VSAPFNAYRITDGHIPASQETVAERRYTDSLDHAPVIVPDPPAEPSPWLLRGLLALAFAAGYLVRSRRQVNIRVTRE
jgi:hypothetical protein